MGTIFVFYDQYYQQAVIESVHRPITIGNDLNSTITIHPISFNEGVITITGNSDKKDLNVQYGKKQVGLLKPSCSLTVTVGSNGEEVQLFYVAKQEKEKIYFIGNQEEIEFSSEDELAEVKKEANTNIDVHETSFSLLRKRNEWYLIPSNSDPFLFVNGEIVKDRVLLNNGDEIFWPFLKITISEGDLLVIKSFEEYSTELPRAAKPTSEMKRKYPEYRRTPRMVYELPDEKVNLSFPYQMRNQNQRGLFLIILPPLIMLIVMGTVAFFYPRGMFMIISIVMFTTTIFTSTIQYFREKRNRKEENERRKRVYTQYLERKRDELDQLAEDQRKILYYHYPSFERMKYLTSHISERIWERTIDAADFMTLRIGTADVPSTYEVAVGSEDTGNREADELVEDFEQLVKVYETVRNVPITIDASYGAVGLIGKHTIVKNEIQQLIGQIAFFHSYHDVRMIAIFNEEEYKDWEWIRWLPHFQLPHMYAKGLIYNEQTRDQLLTSLYEILRERDLDEEKQKKRFVPHFVFIITNRNLISEHLILEYLEGHPNNIGISAIFAADSKESLTENIHTLVRYVNEREGDILIQDKKASHTPFALDEHEKEANERFARTLASLDHQLGMNNSIPTRVTFMEMFGIKDVRELEIARKWQTNISSKSLSVPIGLKGRDDIVELNMHEKAHGPHGLLAGTTGSGKSEFLQTLILSLSVHFHPHDVAFLLIDYKGGGMALPFKNLPHLLGTITNIEGSKNFSNRALASIRAELKRRQRLFDRFGVNHIHNYTDLYRKGQAPEPLPHLFIISDEFAELKAEEPEFIKELVSAARIGRSLGVHLLLATQKPAGVVDDQIWSNSRFRVALKVQDANDSKEILKTSDAANITVTGRGYLQVGNNEVYELFQSAWSGAPYLEDDVSTEDDVAIVTDLGLQKISSVDVPELNKKSETKPEIDIVVEHIAEVAGRLGIKKLASPWLPPLEERLYRPEPDTLPEHVIAIGIKDEPEKQSQTQYHYELVDDGSIGIIGTSGYGKSYTAMTILLSMAEKYTPEELHYYIFDFGNGALLPLRQLPHTGDYFRVDEERKIEKFFALLKAEMDQRKQLFEQKEASNIRIYNSVSDKPLPFMFITVDNFDLIRDEYQDLENQFIQIARDGQSLGIYLIIAATRVNAIRQSLLNNLKTKIVHYLLDKSEVFSVVGRVEFEIEPVPGRAIIKNEEPYLSQVFLPEKGKDDLAVLDAVKGKVAILKKQYSGYKLPLSIPMLPKKLDIPGLFERMDQTRLEPHLYPIGLDEETVQPVLMDLKRNNHTLVIGPSLKGKTNAIKVLLYSAFRKDPYQIGIFDGVDRGLSDLANVDGVSYLETKDQINAWLDSINAEFEQREQRYIEAVTNKTLDRLSFSPVFLVIDSVSRFQQNIDSVLQGKLANTMKRYSHLGFSIIAAGHVSEFSKGYDSFTMELKQIRHALLLMKKSEQNLFNFPYDRREGEIEAGFGYYIDNANVRKIQIPLFTETDIEVKITR